MIHKLISAPPLHSIISRDFKWFHVISVQRAIVISSINLAWSKTRVIFETEIFWKCPFFSNLMVYYAIAATKYCKVRINQKQFWFCCIQCNWMQPWQSTNPHSSAYNHWHSTIASVKGFLGNLSLYPLTFGKRVKAAPCVLSISNQVELPRKQLVRRNRCF